MRFLPSILSIPFFLTATVLPAAPAPSPAPDKRDPVEVILQESVDHLDTLGAVAGVVTPRGKRTYGVGRTALGGDRRPDENTLFEIGSLSKVFLDMLLEDEILKGRFKMDDPVVEHLPPDMPFPKIREFGAGGVKADEEARQVTLWNLVTHTSGFPTMPSRVDLPKDWDPRNPSYVTLDMVRTFFKRYTFPREPGKEYEYSNINTALMGYLLSLKDGRDLETLLKVRILKPLGLKDTAITLTPKQRSRMSKGYTVTSKEAVYMDTPIPFSGGGSLKSCVNDILQYLEKATGIRSSPLDEAMAQQTRVIEPDDGPDRTIGYFYYNQPYGEVFLVRSRTLGFRCCMGFIPSRKIGVVIMGNCMRFDTPEVFRRILECVVRQEEGATGKAWKGKRFEGAPEGAFAPKD